MMMRKILTIGTILIMMTVLINVVYGLLSNSIHCSTYYTDNAIIAESDHIKVICRAGTFAKCVNVCRLATYVYDIYVRHGLKMPKMIKIIVKYDVPGWEIPGAVGYATYPNVITFPTFSDIDIYTVSHEMCHIAQFQYVPYDKFRDNWIVESMADACSDLVTCGQNMTECLQFLDADHVCADGFGHAYTNDLMFYVYFITHQNWGEIMKEILNGNLSPWRIWTYYISTIAKLPQIVNMIAESENGIIHCVYYYRLKHNTTITIKIPLVLRGATRFIVLTYEDIYKPQIELLNTSNYEVFIHRINATMTIVAITFKQPYFGKITFKVNLEENKKLIGILRKGYRILKIVFEILAILGFIP